MKKILHLSALIFAFSNIFAQTDNYWVTHSDYGSKIVTDKAVSRESFPKEFKLFDLKTNYIRQILFSIVGENVSKSATIISLPNAEGKIEQFEVYEASNFEPDLQAQFPEIRAFSGIGITDKNATLKLSISPQGIQTMVFRADKASEFIEAYSQDHTVYAVFKSQREKGKLAWTCSTDDQKMTVETAKRFENTNRSSAGQLKVYRLAQSCNAEYANYFGATSSAQVGLVLAAFNATLTRCNGVYEKDLAMHLNLVASSTNIIYYDPATDPYSTTLSDWNTQLQIAINTTLTGPSTSLVANNAAYDIGHMFGASGGGGNAGCIGCICVDATATGTGSTKGRGITSPSDGIPQGDTFDIDYVTHEIGHQLGGNHTFSQSNEGAGVNKEVGSGITIMGYAGITGQDVATNSIDIFHQATIQQIQTNLATKTCGVTTNISSNNATPIVAGVNNYTIPINTPFVLTGSATDANAGDALTYCWEQNDDGGSNTGAASSASPTKVIGPNFISWPATASPSRYFPTLSSIIANSPTTNATGNDAGILSEALSSVSRTLNFRLTVRDNAPYVSAIGSEKVGQTAFTDMAVNVTASAGPFLVNSPNTAVTWLVGANQNVAWDVAGTTANGINAAFVDIFLSTDGGLTYPIQLASQVPNNGNATIIVPNNVGTTNRVMVKGYQNIFFDISNVNFSIVTPTATFVISESGPLINQICTGSSSVYSFNYSALGGFSGTTTFSATGNPSGSSVVFNPPTMGATSGPVTMTVNGLTGVPAGSYNITATANSDAITANIPFVLNVGVPNVTLLTPSNNATAQNISLTLTWDSVAAATSYDVQVSTNNTFTGIVSSGNVISNSYTTNGLAEGTTYYWRVLPKNDTCTGTYGSPFSFTTGAISCTTTNSPNVPVAIPVDLTQVFVGNSTLNVPSGGIISDINVTMNISHSYVADLLAILTSPSGTEVVLFDSVCGNRNNVNATFDDSGTTLVCNPSTGTTTYTISGTVIPSEPLLAFNDENSTGDWTLTIVDFADGDGGSLNSWSLNICTIQALSSDNFEFQDFALFPNPNKGSFTVEFLSDTSNKIDINVHDISGRQVYKNSFSNNGTFNQNIDLNNVQKGIYLVSILDGDKKTVKRIIVE